jgi:flagellar hook-associated protein 3 FlgL
MLTQQQKVIESQNQLSNNGKRVNTASDDPVASVQIELINQNLTMSQIYKQNNQSSTSALNFEEGILNSVTTTIQTLQQLQVQAGNAALSKEDRQAIAVQAQNILDQLVSYANTTGINGEYIFSGSKSDSPSITKSYDLLTNSTTYNYSGDTIQRFQTVSDSLQVAVNDPASKIFMDIPAGNGSFSVTQTSNPNNGSLVVSADSVSDSSLFVPGDYTLSVNSNTISITDGGGNSVYNAAYQDGIPITFNGMSLTLSGAAADGQTFSIKTGATSSLFASVQSMIRNLTGPQDSASDKAFIQTENYKIINQFRNALANVSQARADLGGRLNQLSSLNTTNDNMTLISRTVLNELENDDISAVASKYNLQLTTLQVAQQSFVRIQSLSIFNYL